MIERLALHELESDGFQSTGFLEAIDRRDVRMIERSKKLAFALEPREAGGIIRERGRKNLEGDRALETRVARAVHLAHSALTDERQNLVKTDSRSWRQRH
jgi:hypothetical protein